MQAKYTNAKRNQNVNDELAPAVACMLAPDAANSVLSLVLGTV